MMILEGACALAISVYFLLSTTTTEGAGGLAKHGHLFIYLCTCCHDSSFGSFSHLLSAGIALKIIVLGRGGVVSAST